MGREWKEDWELGQMGRLFKDVDDERLSGQDGGRSHANSLAQFTWTEDVLLYLVRERLHSWLRAAHTAPAPENTVTSPDRENPSEIFTRFSVH